MVESNSQKPLVCKLKKALYGLKQVLRAWFDRLKTFLLSQGFTNSKASCSLLMKLTNGSSCYILIYVDDIIITGSSRHDIDKLIYQMNDTLSLKDFGKLSYFFGIEVSYPESGGLFLSQEKYITEILQRTKMTDANPIATSMISSTILSSKGSENFENSHMYRSIVARPEITYSVNHVCQFMHSPKLSHWQAVKRIL